VASVHLYTAAAAVGAATRSTSTTTQARRTDIGPDLHIDGWHGERGRLQCKEVVKLNDT
jgi:hypothetical protein